MDPSIVKFMEDDEDESLHSGADVEAFSAALTRDIGGDPPSHAPQPPDHDAELNNQGSNPGPQKLLEQWKASTEDENPGQGMRQTEEQHLQSDEKQHLSLTEQSNQELGVNENDQSTENQSDKRHHHLQEGHSQSDKQWNPSSAVEKDEINTIDKNSFHPHKQERVQSSSSQGHSSQQLNAQQSLASNEENHPRSLQHSNVQQPQGPSETANLARQTKPMPTIPFHLLIPILHPHLDKDRSMQLQAIFTKLRNNEVSKDDFLRVIRNIVGDQMLRQAAQKLQMQLQAQASRNPPTNPNLYSLQNQKGQKSSPNVPASTIQRQTESSFPTLDNSIQKSQVDNKSDGKATHFGQTRSAGLSAGNQEKESATTSLQAVNKPSSSMYGNIPSNFHSHPYPRLSIGAQATTQRLQGQVSQTKQALHAQGITATQLGSSQLMGLANMPKYESIGNESKRIHGGSLASHTLQAYPNKPMSLVKPEVIDQASDPLGRPQQTGSEGSSFGIKEIEQNEQLTSRMGFSTPTTTAGNHALGPAPTSDGTTQISSATLSKTAQKKGSAGHKKPLEASGTSPPSSKKQKTSGAFHDQSIDQLNDVTAVSGVNLREEEEQLLCAPKEESRASEASRKVVQEEEERLILQRGSLQKKLAEITSKYGIKSIGSDVERCLSLCVEERLRGLLSYLIRLAKQRVDSEKARHRFVVTSDVGRQILSINKQIKDNWEKKQAEEAEKLRKANDADIKTGSETEKDKEKEKEKEDGRLKATKANKEEDDKMRTNAANVAARAAVGVGDMLSKWQLMAEQARQKRGGLDGTSSSQSTKTISDKSTPNFKRSELQESETHGSPAPQPGIRRKAPRIQSGMPNVKVPCSISVKDVISALEREPQMSKSSLLYRLYERKGGDSAAVEQLGSL
ncbi:transcription initiation factor TFIID subunit 4b isoform X2 [Phalaenopsis equestris]|uniref:transcription initiation factor TFIID subunit 4b isoform X2 n=1 Tax=Phalaenopsis equestris TaxID=78828 RepID=UPI0009E3EC17|nr:transcription initiation factor TFIID subunit 4b isoform X2 [Phalaenopsis equestris]